MIRTFGAQTLTSTASPWFGDVTTAAVRIQNTQNVFVTVASTTNYQVGDRIILNPAAATRAILRIDKIVSATSLRCLSESAAPLTTYPNGTVIMLALPCWAVDFQLIGAVTAFLGTDSTVTNVPGGSVFRELLPATANAANSYKYEKSTGQNPLNTSEGWMVGTSGIILVAAHVN